MAGILENGELITRFVTPMSVSSNQPVFVSDTLSLKRQVVSHGVQRWEIKTNLEPSNKSADLLIHSVVNGYQGVFDISMPQVYIKGFKDTRTKLIRTTVSVASGDNTFQTSGATTANQLIKGEFITFSNHQKVYLVTNVVTANNISTVTVFPNIIINVPTDNIIDYGSNVILKARYDTDVILGITYVDGILSDMGTVTFIEAL